MKLILMLAMPFAILPTPFSVTFSAALTVALTTLSPAKAFAEGSKKKVQEVDFEGEDVDGVVRRPDGMFLVQKKSIDFVPLYKVRDGFDQNIRESVEHLR